MNGYKALRMLLSSVLVVAIAFFAVGCGESQDGRDSTSQERGTRGTAGKADLSGTCQNACGGSSDDTLFACFCDDECQSYQDCCDDYVAVCLGTPCAGLTCGDACKICDPNDPNCFETAVVKYCDADGFCSQQAPQCESGEQSEPYEPCAGLTCGDPCKICDPNDLNCFETAVVKTCDADGFCSPQAPQCESGSLPAAWVASDEIELPNGDMADLYFPNPPAPVRSQYTDAFPVAVVLQGAQVDKSQYADFARAVAQHGFVVVVPNRLRALGPPGSPEVPFTEANVIAEALTSVEALDRDPSSALFQVADTSQAGVVGHSFGGVAGLQAIGGMCVPPFCTPPFALPPAVRAGAFYGTDLFPPGPPGAPVIDVATNGIGVALLRGSLDGRSLPERIEATYDVLDDNRALITVVGANHYGITNDAEPAGSQPDPNISTLENEASVRAIGEWTARWLRAELLGDQEARSWLTELGQSVDGSVVVDDVRLD